MNKTARTSNPRIPQTQQRRSKTIPSGPRLPKTSLQASKDFVCEFLTQDTRTPPPPRMSYPIEGVVKPTILVVDDTPDNLSLMRELLRKDYQVQLANGGERALKLAAMQPQPDLILLDIMMPVINSYGVPKARQTLLRATSRSFLTAKADVEDEKRGLELGVIVARPSPSARRCGARAGRNSIWHSRPMQTFCGTERFLGSRGWSKRTREVLAIAGFQSGHGPPGGNP